ncbi:N-lysine methyltransferase KMT5A-A-like isoform X2 [Phymastichus coffea]|nr:N-lysine methyltransferase KMT5A-A-like isoform X2 [Phymastichus coffea]
MTNSKSVVDASFGVEETFTKCDVKKQNTNSNSDVDHKENLKTQINIAIKQDSKKFFWKSHLQKPIEIKQEVDNKKQRVTRNTSKTLNKSSCFTESSMKYDKCNKKNKSRVNKEHVVSPNHSITEYFSSLDLKESVKDIDEKSKKIEPNKDNLNSHSSLSSIESTKNSLSQAKRSNLRNHKLTEYFAIRRSDRKLKKDTDIEKQNDLEKKIMNEVEDGLEIKEFNEKGRGIITTKEFYKGDFVIEYIGDLIDGITAKQREAQYAKRKNVGCYMYYFKHKDRQYCIDATKESGKLGRLINHSRKGNLTSRIIEVNGIPHLILFAKADISPGTELLYDYGDRNQESIKNHPWLNL